MILAVIILLAVVLGLLLWRDRAKHGAAARPAREILVDGSNVMWWNGDEPRLETLRAVVALLHHRGLTPGVIFDASAGHRLFGRYRDDGFVSAALGLPAEQVLVVPKGEVADRYLLTVARERNLCIVTNDRYRDWQYDFPEAREKGRLLQGGYRGGQLWLEEGHAELPRQGQPKRPAGAGRPGRP